MTSCVNTLQDCLRLDEQDPLRGLRGLFDIPDDLIYLDGNSLGALPRAAPARLAQAITQEWGQGLIRSWNSAGWFDMPRRVGDKIAQLIGARTGEVVAVDSTSVNLYKVLSAALQIARHDGPGRKVVLSERSNFPTDLYIAQSLCQQHAMELRLVESGQLLQALGDDVAVLMLTHVNYRTGAMHDMAALGAAAQRCGVLTLWDLAHSAGAVELDLHAEQADFAVGCGYKYLNGGPGAPAFLWVHPKHSERFWQPLSGWWGHAQPFAFEPGYQPAAGIGRYQCGTQPMLSLIALDVGVDTVLAAQPLGGMAALRRKSLALTRLFGQLIEQRLAGHGLNVVSPSEDGQRGSQLSLTRAQGAYAIVQALIERGVVGDFRAGDGAAHPDILRFGVCPLYTRYVDIWHAVDRLHEVMVSGAWQEAKYGQQQSVT